MQKLQLINFRRGQPKARPRATLILGLVALLVSVSLAFHPQPLQAQSTPTGSAPGGHIYLPLVANQLRPERVTAAAATLILNTASVSADQTDSDTTDNGAASCIPVGAGSVILNNAGVSNAEASRSISTTAASCITVAAASVPNLIIGKSGPATAIQNTNFNYTLVITNTGTAPTSGIVTVSDSLPAGLSFVSGSGGGFTCAASGQIVTCTGSTALAATNGTATVTLTVNPTTTGAQANTASVIGGGDTTAATSNTVNTMVSAGNAAPVITQPATDPASISMPENTTAVVDVNATDDHDSEGSGLTYSLSGADAAKFTIDATGHLAFISPPDFENPTDSGANNVYDVVVTVTDSGGLTDSVTLAVTVTDVADSPNLIIGKSGPATALQNANFNYTLAITNTGTTPTSGIVTVSDILPAGLSFVSGSGGGFTCAASGQTVTCTGSTALAATNGTATLTLAVNAGSPGVKSNSASVLGGGDPSSATSNTVNTTVSAAIVPLLLNKVVVSSDGIDPQPGDNGDAHCMLAGAGTVLLNKVKVSANETDATATNNFSAACVSLASSPDLKIGKSGPATATQGTNFAYTLIVTNTGTVASSGMVTVTDSLPAGLSFVSGSGGGFACAASGQTVTCTSSTAIAATNGTATISLMVNPTTTGAKANIATVIGGGDPSTATSNTANTTVNAASGTSITLTSLKVFLQGPYVSSSGLMRDDLRTLNLLPTSSPYVSAAATANASVFAVSGNNAIVDWVLVELRNSTTPATIVASQAAFVQRDGDVVGLDGTSPLSIPVSAGNYYVAVKHRNHLGVMTASAISLATSSPVIDFTLPATAVYGTNTRRTVGNSSLLWSGNANGDTRIITAGPNNDNNTVLTTVLSAPGNTLRLNNYVVNGYANGDVNLDGKVLAAGPNNDINLILYNIFIHPGNVNLVANYIITQQLP